MMTEEKQMNDRLGLNQAAWDLRFLYPPEKKGETARKADMAWCGQRALELSGRFAGQVAGLGAQELAELVQALEALDEKLARLASYAYLNFITQTGNAAASALLQEVEELAAAVGGQTVFFQVEWNQLAPERAQALMQAPELLPWRHYLATLRHMAPHQLGVKEEELLQELAPTGRSAWNLLFEKVMSQMRFGRDARGEEEILADLYRPERDIRRRAAEDFSAGLKSNLHILTHIFNTLAQEKMIMDRLRRFPAWNSAIDLQNELRPETAQALVDAVTANYGIVQRYYRMKRKILGFDELFDYDRYAPLPQPGAEEPIPWQECQHTVLAAFSAFSPEMAEIASGFFTEARIHAPVVPGKGSGAFAHPTVPSAKPYILVNYTGRRQDLFTVAHELGHGVHQTLAARQGYYQSETPLVLAETASVFAEMLLFQDLLTREQDPMRRRALICEKLESIFATIFRQVAMNRFEKAMHEGRRQQGELSSAELSAFWMRTQEAMFADSVSLSENYRLWWAYIPHFLTTPGYVYAYAFGELLVLALYARYKREGAAFVPSYLELLGAGGGEDPYTLLDALGINLNEAAFWQEGLALVEALLVQAESAL